MAGVPTSLPHRPEASARGHASVREGIAAVAVRLFLERGFVETTIDDIAAESGVSRRTYFRYFATKDDTILEYLERLGDTLVERLLARPAGERPLTAAQNALREVLTETTEDTALARSLGHLIYETPALRARQLAIHADWQSKMADALAVREGLPETDLRSQVIAAIVGAAFQLGGDRWTYSKDGPLSAYVDEVIDAIRAERVAPKA